MKILAKGALIVLLGVVLSRASSSALADTGDQDALAAVAHDLCHRQIAMLGESNTHGDGHTEAFKVALVERLVNTCGFDRVLFEASHYEFLSLAEQFRLGQPVSAEQLSSAVGGLWKFDREFQPLVPFLLAKAQSGQIVLGGLDDQLGEAGQDYANLKMVTELTDFLPQPQRQDCSLAMHRRIYSDNQHPTTESDDAQISRCLKAIQVAVTGNKVSDPMLREEHLEMVSDFQRWIGRDFFTGAERGSGRDHSMFLNLEWYLRQHPRHHKVILWAATVHIAKESDLTPPNNKGNNLGWYVHQEYGGRAFSLGFSALTGSYRQGRRDVHEVPAAPPNSVEAQALEKSGSDAAYIGRAQLAAMGTVPGAILRHSYETLPWSKLLDGVVVFREERPPNSSR